MPEEETRARMFRNSVIALSVGVALAIGGWALAQDKPAEKPREVTAAATTPAPPPKPDPGGVSTGGLGDVTAKTTGKPTLEEIAEAAGHNKISINVVWTL